MCVTSAPAHIAATQAFTYATIEEGRPQTFHISGYQNSAKNRGHGPNCMFLHFPAFDIQLVSGPEQTRHFMRDLTRNLPALKPSLGPVFLGTRGVEKGARVEAYGDYHVVLAQHATEILAALDQVPQNRRPTRTPALEAVVNWYHDQFSGYSFVLACFDGSVQPQHPIVVEYVPHSDDVLYVPGLDAHDGGLPEIGKPVPRDFRVAFAHDGYPQPLEVYYSEPIAGTHWAPADVTGFYDNRTVAPNGDYVLPLESIDRGFIGAELLDVLVS